MKPLSRIWSSIWTIFVRARKVAAVVILAWLVDRTLLVTIDSSTTSVEARMATATMISSSVKPESVFPSLDDLIPFVVVADAEVRLDLERCRS